jgi:hypothetical protein
MEQGGTPTSLWIMEDFIRDMSLTPLLGSAHLLKEE